MRKLHRNLKERGLAWLLTAAIVAGLLPTFSPTAKASNTIAIVDSITLSSGEYTLSNSMTGKTITVPSGVFAKITVPAGADVILDNQSSGGSPIDIQPDGALSLITDGTLRVLGQMAQNGYKGQGYAAIPQAQGGFAGIHVPVGALLIVTGEGNLSAQGGDAGNGGRAGTPTGDGAAGGGGSGYPAATIGGGGAGGGSGTSGGTNTSDSNITNGGGAGGGGGGAGAGIGGNGGNGAANITFDVAGYGLDGENGETAGTIFINVATKLAGGVGGAAGGAGGVSTISGGGVGGGGGGGYIGGKYGMAATPTIHGEDGGSYLSGTGAAVLPSGAGNMYTWQIKGLIGGGGGSGGYGNPADPYHNRTPETGLVGPIAGNGGTGGAGGAVYYGDAKIEAAPSHLIYAQLGYSIEAIRAKGVSSIVASTAANQLEAANVPQNVLQNDIAGIGAGAGYIESNNGTCEKIGFIDISGASLTTGNSETYYDSGKGFKGGRTGRLEDMGAGGLPPARRPSFSAGPCASGWEPRAAPFPCRVWLSRGFAFRSFRMFPCARPCPSPAFSHC